MSRRTMPPHLFVPDPAIPPGMDGRTACLTCHLIGERGDTRHKLPDAQPDVQSLAAGERGEP